MKQLLLSVAFICNSLPTLAFNESSSGQNPSKNTENIEKSTEKTSAKRIAYRSRIYAVESDKSNQVYNSVSTVSFKKGVRTEINQFFYSDKQDRVAVEEIVTFSGNRSDSPLKKYIVKHYQLQENWEIEVVGDKLHFLKSNWKTGKVERDSETKRGDFVVGPLVRTLLKKKWPQLMSGKRVKVRFAVPARKETVGFEIFRDKDKEVAGSNYLVLKMKPSSFLISMVVDPFYMRLSKNGSRIFQTTGYNLPRKMKDGEWKDAIVDTVFDYPEKPKSI